MPILEKAGVGDEIHDLIERVMHDHHAVMESHKVTIGVKWVRPKTKADWLAPLKLHGYPAAAVIKITPYEQRVEGIEDAVIKIDQRRWKGLSLSAREALIDHELTHLTLVRNKKTDDVLEDDLGRPRLRMKLHDVELGVFDSIIRRHGESSLDYQHVAAVMARYRQEVFAFADDMAQPDQSAIVKDAFGALLSVGHTEGQARARIDAATKGGKTFASVNDLIEAACKIDPPGDVAEPLGNGEANGTGRGKKARKVEQGAAEASS